MKVQLIVLLFIENICRALELKMHLNWFTLQHRISAKLWPIDLFSFVCEMPISPHVSSRKLTPVYLEIFYSFPHKVVWYSQG